MTMNIIDTLVPNPGLRVFITAGADGIGLVIARAFRDSGAHVLVCDVEEPSIERLAITDPDIESVKADVSRMADVDGLRADIEKKLGGLDVVINNAGIAGPTGKVDTVDPSEWLHTIDVNINGQYFIARLTVPFLRESEGVMICMSSVAGRLGYAFRTPYSASKWAVVGFVESLARELGPDGVRVNAILPGVIRGDRIHKVIEARSDAVGISYEEMEERYLQLISLRRMTDPEDVAAMALFLASPGARNISGQAISVCGNVENL